MNAKAMFRKGDRVQMTQIAIDRYLDRVGSSRWGNCGEYRTGTVVGFARRPDLVRVRREGLRTPYTYWVGFWERIK